MTKIIKNTIVDGDIPISELTEGTYEGNGIYEVLMRTTAEFLDKEVKTSRLSGQAYATVLSNAIPAVLDQAVRFAVHKSKLAYELEALDLQNKQAEAQTASIEEQTRKTSTEIAVLMKEGALTEARICEVKANTNRVNAEVSLKLPAEVEDIKSRTLNTDENTQLISKQILGVVKDNEIKGYNLSTKLPAEVAYLRAQTDNLDKQGDLLEQELLIKVQELAIREKEVALREAELDLAGKQTALMEQKVITEKAQTDGTVIGAGSAMYHSNQLMLKQTEAYDKEHLVKVAKIYTDTHAVSVSNGDGEASPGNGLDDPAILAVMSALRSTIT